MHRGRVTWNSVQARWGKGLCCSTSSMPTCAIHGHQLVASVHGGIAAWNSAQARWGEEFVAQHKQHAHQRNTWSSIIVSVHGGIAAWNSAQARWGRNLWRSTSSMPTCAIHGHQ